MESFLGEGTGALKKVWTLFTSIRSLEGDMKSLRDKTGELSAREEDVMTEVVREEVEQGKKRKREVVVWLHNVKRIKREVDGIEEKVREERGWISRYKLTNQIEDMKTEVVQLHNRSAFSDGVATELILGSQSPQPAATLLGESADKTLKRIWNSLLDEEIRKVGVYGMGGVGKTTIMKHIHNQLLHSGVFESIIWVTVSQALDLCRLQREIATAIKLNLSNTSDVEESTSSKIHAKLSQGESCLLILDDLWKPFSLDRIGIPEPNQTNGFKLAITTRSLNVCTGMESERIVKVEVLSTQEAWDLFKEKVGGSVLDSAEIKPIAELVCKECSCLPLAVITVGRALREVGDVSVWRTALNELKCSNTELDGMDEVVFPRLWFSYNRLKNPRFKDCFLYCALYPEDHMINPEELIDNWVGEGLIDEVGNLEKERDKGYTILRELNDACMIEYDRKDSTGKPFFVKLHDLIRDLAMKITREKPRFMVKSREQLEESPRAEEWMEDTKRVSLMFNCIRVLSGQPMCPELTTFLLQGNRLLTEISSSFFEKITGLRVLDLSNTSIISLPESFCGLTSLHVLRLNSCPKLKNVPCLAKLKHLQVLSLEGTSIEELPQGMEELINLRRLNLNYTTSLNLFPAEIISKMSRLEELLMNGSRWRWPSDTGRAAPGIEEIVNLPRITHLSISFADAQGFNSLVGSGKLQKMKSYTISLGDRYPTYAYRNYSKIVLIKKIHRWFDSTLMLPCDTNMLEIEGCHDVTRLSQFSWLPNLKRLKLCRITNCDGMEFVVMTDEKTLPNLEELFLYQLPNLRGLSDGVASIETFADLRILDIMFCKKMKSLISFGLLQNLRNLESIHVDNCESMEDIVADDGDSLTTTFSLPKLKDLSVHYLQELKSLFKTTITCPSLESVEVIDCPKLKKLPFISQNLPPTLKKIGGGKEWWDALEWDDPDIKIQLQDLFTALWY